MMTPLFQGDDDLDYDVVARELTGPMAKRLALGDRLAVTGRQRVANEARFARRPASGFSGAHRRKNKGYQI